MIIHTEVRTMNVWFFGVFLSVPELRMMWLHLFVDQDQGLHAWLAFIFKNTVCVV